jgi:hypothetical protein
MKFFRNRLVQEPNGLRSPFGEAAVKAYLANGAAVMAVIGAILALYYPVVAASAGVQ